LKGWFGVKLRNRATFLLVISLILIMILGSCYPSPEISSEVTTSNSSAASTTTSSDETSSPTTSQPSISSAAVPSPSAEYNKTVTGKMTVSFLDVGQADSIFVELPNQETLLIDAGNPDDGNPIVKYIKDKGYTKIDYLVGTHPHSDHVGGMSKVVNSLDISHIYMPKASNNTQTFEEILSVIQDKGLKVTTAKAGVNILDYDNLKIKIIAPKGDSYDDLNNYSAVIKLTYGSTSFLFMGDAEAISEDEITADVKADVLKVGHHGSNSSTGQDFLNKVSPKYAVISVGFNNEYGHPAQITLDNLTAAKAKIYRTDKDGTIVFSSDGTNITVSKSTSYTPTSTPSAKPTETQVPPPIKPTPSQTETNNEDQSITVYVTDTGSKYHTANCKYLKKSKHAISLDGAKAEGYEPCSVCNPPT
jgi:competence protein ComEC